MSGGVPVQVPSSAVSVWPSLGVPEIAAATVLTGARRATTAVVAPTWPARVAAAVGGGDDDADGLADVGGRRACRSSAVAPAMSTQLAPAASQRCHW